MMMPNDRILTQHRTTAVLDDGQEITGYGWDWTPAGARRHADRSLAEDLAHNHPRVARDPRRIVLVHDWTARQSDITPIGIGRG